MKFLRRLFCRQPQASIDFLIARRAVRVSNRRADVVTAYQRVHAILAARND